MAWLAGPGAAQELSFRYGATLQHDLRIRPDSEEIGEWYEDVPDLETHDRNELLFKGKFWAEWRRFAAKGDIDFVANFRPAPDGPFDGLFTDDQLRHYRADVNELYVEVRDLFTRYLDLRVGQQLVQWGVGDRFNPTNNLNANDVDDILLFGRQLGNFMVRANYAPRPYLTFNAVLVPRFKAARLPRTAPVGISENDRSPFTDRTLGWWLQTGQVFARDTLGFPTVVDEVDRDEPAHTLENMQYSFRVAGTLGLHDLALSYYEGFIDFPQTVLNVARQAPGFRCNPDDPGDCINGLIETDVTLGYPEVRVVGLNLAGELDVFGWLGRRLDPFGYRIEVGYYMPERTEVALFRDFEIPGGPTSPQLIEIDYDRDGQPGGPRPRVIDGRNYLKWSVGLDYTITPDLYANVQWVHGLADEHGAGDFFRNGEAVRRTTITPDPFQRFVCSASGDGRTCAAEVLKPRLNDYLLFGVDYRFFSQQGLLRLFAILDLSGVDEEYWHPARQRRVSRHHGPFSEKGFSAVVFPELQYNFGNGVEIHLGGLVQLGKPYSKFGDAAAGGNLIWTRLRYSF